MKRFIRSVLQWLGILPAVNPWQEQLDAYHDDR